MKRYLRLVVENCAAFVAVLGFYAKMAKKRMFEKKPEPVALVPDPIEQIKQNLPGDAAVVIEQDKEGKPLKALYRPGKTGPATTADVVGITEEYGRKVVILRHPGNRSFRRVLHSKFLIAA
jgi:hypothetical protein